MATITSSDAGGASRYINLGSDASQDSLGAQTIIAYVSPATQIASSGYLFAKGDSAGLGPRFYITTAMQLGAGFDSSTSAQPDRSTTAQVTAGVWQHLQMTWDGTINSSGIKLYIDADADASSGSNGSGTIVSDAAHSVFLMNRVGLGRDFLGDKGYVARWNRVLSDAERTTVRATGPLDVPSGLTLCYANDQDYSTNAIAYTARSTRVTGSTPTNTALGGTSALNLAPSLFTNANTFYAATVTPGAVSLQPTLFTNANVFYTPVVAIPGGEQFLVPALFVNTNQFYAPVVYRLPGFLTPVMKNNTGTLHASVTGIAVTVWNKSTKALVVHKTGLTSGADGVLLVEDAALAVSTDYLYEIDLSVAALGRGLPTGTAS